MFCSGATPKKGVIAGDASSQLPGYASSFYRKEELLATAFHRIVKKVQHYKYPPVYLTSELASKTLLESIRGIMVVRSRETMKTLWLHIRFEIPILKPASERLAYQ
jgi:hypothetical protein